MTSFRDCGMCGGSGRHSFERCFECKGLGLVEDEPDGPMYETLEEMEEAEQDHYSDLHYGGVTG